MEDRGALSSLADISSIRQHRAHIHLLHLVQIIGASVVDIMAESSSEHGKGFKVCVVFL